MALIATKVSDIFEAVRDTLQDTQENRWTNEELFRYLNQGIRDIAVRTKYKYEKDVFDVTDASETYDLNFEVIELFKVDTTQEYEVLNDQAIKFPNMKEEEVTVEYYAYPARIAYSEDLEITIEDDICGAIKNYVLFKAYEKEDSTESLNKAQYFYQHYLDSLNQDMSRWHGKIQNDFAKNDFYI